jgi:hypothetical protein
MEFSLPGIVVLSVNGISLIVMRGRQYGVHLKVSLPVVWDFQIRLKQPFVLQLF